MANIKISAEKGANGMLAFAKEYKEKSLKSSGLMKLFWSIMARIHYKSHLNFKQELNLDKSKQK